jgi:hypothetical protein
MARNGRGEGRISRSHPDNGVGGGAKALGSSAAGARRNRQNHVVGAGTIASARGRHLELVTVLDARRCSASQRTIDEACMLLGAFPGTNGRGSWTQSREVASEAGIRVGRSIRRLSRVDDAEGRGCRRFVGHHSRPKQTGNGNRGDDHHHRQSSYAEVAHDQPRCSQAIALETSHTLADVRLGEVPKDDGRDSGDQPQSDKGKDAQDQAAHRLAVSLLFSGIVECLRSR